MTHAEPRSSAPTHPGPHPLLLSPLVPVGAPDASPFPFLDLPIPLQHGILDLCDPHTLGHLSQCCSELRELACNEAQVVTVPRACSGEELSHAPLYRFPAARRLVLSGRYPTLQPSHLDAFLYSLRPRPSSTHSTHSTLSTLCGTSPPAPAAGGRGSDGAAAAAAAWMHGCGCFPSAAPAPHLRSHFPHLSELCLVQLRLSHPLPLSVVQSLPEVWPGLRRLELVGVRFNCPLSCSKREALEAVLSPYCVEEGGARLLPGMVLVWAVDVHEQRIDRNILVSLELCRVAGGLPCLRHLVLRGHEVLHVHDSALKQLTRCTQLQSLAVDVAPDWPPVTGRSISALPPSLQTLVLGSQNPEADARLLLHTSAASTLEVSPLPPPRQRLLPSQQLLDGYVGHTAMGRLDRHPMPTLNTLSTLSWRSAVRDPGPEDPEGEEGQAAARRRLQEEAVAREVQEKEGKTLRRLIAASPQLQHLRLESVGQALLEGLLESVEVVPSHTLDVSLHYGVNPLPLLYSQTRASLAITVQGAGAADLRVLCTSQHAAQARPGLTSNAVSNAVSNRLKPSLNLNSNATASIAMGGAAGKSGKQRITAPVHNPSAAPKLATAPAKASGPKLSKKERKAAEAAAAAELKRLQLEQQRLEQEQRRAAQRAAAAAAAAAGKWEVPSGPRLGLLQRLHLQHCPDITDQCVAECAGLCPTLSVLQLTSCRSITSQVVKEFARLRRPIKLGCAMCREVTCDGWREAAAVSRHIPGAVVRDIVLPRKGDSVEGPHKEEEEGALWVEFGP